MNHRRITAVIPVSMLLCAPVGAAWGQLAVGTGPISEVWNSNCANCHGVRGQGGGAGTSSLLGDEFMGAAAMGMDRPFFDAIKHGVPESGMPAFGETMNDAQIWALTVYLRELQHRDWRARHGSPRPDEAGAYTSAHERFRVEAVADSGLDVPWAMDFLPDGRVIVTERPGGVRVLTPGEEGEGWRVSAPVKGTPEVRHRGQGGMMEVALHPEYERNGWVYLAFADGAGSGRNSPGMTKIVRGRIKEDGEGGAVWADEETIFKAEERHYLPTNIHFGCRMAFQKDEGTGRYFLYFTIGERGMGEHAQDLSRPNGKVHRVYDDGEVPADNPFNTEEGKAKGWLGTIWSYGHRNPQGLVFDERGELWMTEHGPRGGDELNRVVRGGNYGWPEVSYGMNYVGSPYRTPWPDEGQDFEMPVDRWLPSIGACGLDVVRGGAFDGWKGDLLAGGLSGQNLGRVRVADDGDGRLVVVEREELLHGLGRVRDVSVAPDGTVFIALNGPDRVIRLVPAGE